ncbi:hypothetical protein MYAM1_001154 [Malassezia yamatoensis]|uniref:Arrestin C-terminal-like domain-containing protein n=1 Tax=Malassezia yamatoensis TaxID=253288 RepID=A0AAJ6CFL7_9BASI|nr:hypothetical protein MYAM1_001154 [Malassezia yamatoensis]
MAGLGINFGSLGQQPNGATAVNSGGIQRHAHLVKEPSSEARQNHSTPVRLPCAPLRENRVVSNSNMDTSKKFLSVPAQHLLPPKPTSCVLSPSLAMYQASQVELIPHANSPGENSISSQDANTLNPASPSTPLTIAHAEAALPFLPASLQTFHSPRPAAQLPIKPETTPMLPLERDHRVGIEIFLEEDRAVEGGCIQGCIRLRIPKHTSPHTAMLLAQPRVRLIGFEAIPEEDTRHLFYHHASVIDGDRSNDGPSEPYVLHGSPAMTQPLSPAEPPLPCYASLPDSDGFYLGKEGIHVLPFTLQLPIARAVKGSYRSEQAEIGYIAIASVRVRSFSEQQGGIANCFQKIDLFPYLNPNEVLASALHPLLEQASDAQVRLAAALHRETWVAGQRVYFDMSVLNRAADTMNFLQLSLLCTELVYRSRGDNSSEDSVSSTTRTLLKQTLDASEDNAGHWWQGVRPGPPTHFGHSIVLPADALSIERSRHIDVQYTLQIGVGSGPEPRIQVKLPLRIVHFVSLDPPPSKRTFTGANLLNYTMEMPSDQGQMVERVKSMDTLKSPRAAMSASGHLLPSPAIATSSLHTPSERTAQHRRSLDFINSAIRSATARRSPPYAQAISEADAAGLGIELGMQPPKQPLRSRGSWYKSQRESRRANDASIGETSLPSGSEPTQDTSLDLGDETHDDLDLVFDSARTKVSPNKLDISMDDDGGSTLCHDILDAYSNQSQDMSNSISEPPQFEAEKPARILSPLNRAAKQPLPMTPPQKLAMTSHPVSEPSKDIRALERASFTFATNSSPLKVKASSRALPLPKAAAQDRSLPRVKSTASLLPATVQLPSPHTKNSRTGLPRIPGERSTEHRRIEPAVQKLPTASSHLRPRPSTATLKSAE